MGSVDPIGEEAMGQGTEEFLPTNGCVAVTSLPEQHSEMGIVLGDNEQREPPKVREAMEGKLRKVLSQLDILQRCEKLETELDGEGAHFDEKFAVLVSILTEVLERAKQELSRLKETGNLDGLPQLEPWLAGFLELLKEEAQSSVTIENENSRDDDRLLVLNDICLKLEKQIQHLTPRDWTSQGDVTDDSSESGLGIGGDERAGENEPGFALPPQAYQPTEMSLTLLRSNYPPDVVTKYLELLLGEKKRIEEQIYEECHQQLVEMKEAVLLEVQASVKQYQKARERRFYTKCAIDRAEKSLSRHDDWYLASIEQADPKDKCELTLLFEELKEAKRLFKVARYQTLEIKRHIENISRGLTCVKATFSQQT